MSGCRSNPQFPLAFSRNSTLGVPLPSHWITETHVPYGKERQQRLNQRIQACIDAELTDIQRQVLRLYYQQHLTMQEIADQQGVTRSAVSRSIRRGVARLQRMLPYYLDC